MGKSGKAGSPQLYRLLRHPCPGPVRGSSSHRANSHSSGKQNLNRRSRHLPLKPKAAQLGAACDNSPACCSPRPGRSGGVETGHWLDKWEEYHKSWFLTPPKDREREDNVATGALLPCCFLKDREGPVISKCSWMHEGFCTVSWHVPCRRARQSRAPVTGLSRPCSQHGA